MTLLLTNEEVEQALTPQDAIAATESIYRELAEGKALNRARSQVYLPAESREHPGFQYRMKTQEGGSLDCGVWALRVTSDMAGFSYTNGIKRRRILPVATGNKYCGLVILFDVEKIEPVAIMPDGVIQKVRVAAMSAVGARYLAPDRPRVLGLFGSGWQAGAHIEFLAAQYSFDQIKVFSPNQKHCREFCRSMSEKLGREVRAAGTPKEIVALLSRATATALGAPDVRERFAALALDISAAGPEEFRRLLQHEVKTWQEVIVKANEPLQ